MKNYNELTPLEKRKLNKIKKRIERSKEKKLQFITCYFVNRNIIEKLKQEGYNISYYYNQTRYGVTSLYIIELNKE